MNCATRFGLVLVANIGIATGVVLPGVVTVQPVVAQTQADAAKRAFDEGMRLFNKSDVESLRQAIGQFERAFQLSQQNSNQSLQGYSVVWLGQIYSDLGEKQKALDYYNQALPILRVVGDRGGEAVTLNNIGLVYSDLGEKQKALDYYNQALPIRQAVGDRGGEAVALRNLASLNRAQNNLTTALKNINAAIEIIEYLRNEIKDNNLKTTYSKSVQDYYDFKADLLIQLQQK
jgi:tetratricopeptide (TPR) repeat protein